MITLGRSGDETSLLAQKTFQKGIQQGTEYFNFLAGNIRIYNMYSLLYVWLDVKTDTYFT